jgi:hypothetical protein
MKIKVENNGYGKHQWADITVETNGGELKESSIDVNSEEANDLILQFGNAMGALLSMQLDKKLLTESEITEQTMKVYGVDNPNDHYFANAIESAVRRKLGVE